MAGASIRYIAAARQKRAERAAAAAIAADHDMACEILQPYRLQLYRHGAAAHHACKVLVEITTAVLRSTAMQQQQAAARRPDLACHAQDLACHAQEQVGRTMHGVRAAFKLLAAARARTAAVLKPSHPSW